MYINYLCNMGETQESSMFHAADDLPCSYSWTTASEMGVKSSRNKEIELLLVIPKRVLSTS